MKKIYINILFVFTVFISPVMAFESYFSESLHNLKKQTISSDIERIFSKKTGNCWLKQNFPFDSDHGRVTEYHFDCNRYSTDYKLLIFADINTSFTTPIRSYWNYMLRCNDFDTMLWEFFPEQGKGYHAIVENESEIIYHFCVKDQQIMGRLMKVSDGRFRIYELRVALNQNIDELQMINDFLLPRSNQVEELIKIHEFNWLQEAIRQYEEQLKREEIRRYEAERYKDETFD